MVKYIVGHDSSSKEQGHVFQIIQRDVPNHCKMSASHRSLSRLPLSIFDNLLHYSHSTDTKDKPLIPPKDLRFNICERLNASHQQIKGKENVTTVGQLLRMTSPALLRALDPILTQGML